MKLDKRYTIQKRSMQFLFAIWMDQKMMHIEINKTIDAKLV